MNYNIFIIPILIFGFGGLIAFGLNKKIADLFYLIISGISLIISGYGAFNYLNSNEQSLKRIIYYSTSKLGVIFGLTVDSASVFMELLLTLIAFLVGIYAVQYMEKTEEESKRKGYLYGWISIALAGALLSIYSSSIIQLIIGLEIMAIPFSFLVNFNNKNSIKGWKLLAVQNFAVLLLLATLLYTGKSDLRLINQLTLHEKMISFILMLFAVFAMSSQFFFYSWLPDSTQAPIPVSALIHSVTIVNAGVLFFLRIIQYIRLPVEAFDYVWPFTTAILFLMIIYYPLEKDAKKLIAYSTIAQAAVSYTVISYGILGERVGLEVGFYQMINHIIVKTIAFLSVGFFIYKLGTSDLEKIRGIRYILPEASVAWFLSFYGLAGVLPLGLFFGKMFAIMSTMHGVGITSWLIPFIILLDAGVFFVVVSFWFREIFFGSPQVSGDITEGLRRPTSLMIISILILIIIGSIMPWTTLGLAEKIAFAG